MDGIKVKCDFCDAPAVYDAKTVYGPWGYLCRACFDRRALKEPGTYSLLESIQQTKKCCHCGETKPINEFYGYTDGHGVHRFRAECKACNLAQRRKRRLAKK